MKITVQGVSLRSRRKGVKDNHWRDTGKLDGASGDWKDHSEMRGCTEVLQHLREEGLASSAQGKT